MTLTRSFAALTALVLTAATAIPVTAQGFAQHRDQETARQRLLDGHAMPFSIIKRKVEKEMGDASFVGVAPPPREGVYRMQFLRKDGVVVWVDVDGKSGNIIARTK